MTRQISYDEIKKHDSENSTWIVIHNDVYDVTKYLEEHPGGVEAILDYAGKDGTQPFEDVGHSSDAREVMKKFKIGSLPESERNKVPSTKTPKCPQPSNTLKWALIALAGAIVIGIALRKYSKG